MIFGPVSFVFDLVLTLLDLSFRIGNFFNDCFISVVFCCLKNVFVIKKNNFKKYTRVLNYPSLFNIQFEKLSTIFLILGYDKTSNTKHNGIKLKTK